MRARICRAHDADDLVPDRVCGHRLPCPDHPRGWAGVRLKPKTQPRNRGHVVLTLSDEERSLLRELVARQGRPASRIVGDLIRAAARRS